MWFRLQESGRNKDVAQAAGKEDCTPEVRVGDNMVIIPFKSSDDFGLI